MNNIKRTNNYEIFKQVNGNRKINQTHLNKLTKSINEKNLLSYNPVIVNENMEIIDGQHRVLAAKALGIDVYYIVVPEADLDEVIRLNADNLRWLTSDYLQSFIELGKKEYIKLKEFVDEYKFSIPISICIISGASTESGDNLSRMRDIFRKGKFIFENPERAEEIASFLSEMRKRSLDRTWTQRHFIMALISFMEKSDPKLLIQKMDRYSLVLTRRVSKKDYLVELEEFVNYGERKKLIELV